MKFMILRDMGDVSLAEPFAVPGTTRVRGARAGAPAVRRAEDAASLEVSVEVEELSKSDVKDIARDPSVRALAPAFPTRLIEPLASAAAEETAWGISAVGADDTPFDGAGVKVAVLDTGIDRTHAAFQGMSLREEDFSGSGNGDAQGHGTHCAGTIFGRDVDGVRIGVAPGVQEALIGKVLGDDGRGDSEMIFRGIQWAVNNNADVISMSLGFDFPGLVEHLIQELRWPATSATSYALQGYRANVRMFDELMDIIRARASGEFSQGGIVCAAAGNENFRSEDSMLEIAVSLPAAADGVVSVGALQRGTNGFTVAEFSNTFPQIAAPGVDVLSARSGGGLLSLSGTSMATPHVAGVAALWWQSVRDGFSRPNAALVLAKLLASASRQGMDHQVDEADIGVGIVRVPR